MPSVFDTSPVGTVTYKSQRLKRSTANAAGIMSYSTVGARTCLPSACARTTRRFRGRYAQEMSLHW